MTTFWIIPMQQMYIFFNCNVMQKDAQDIFLCWLLNIEPLLVDYYLDKLGSVILIHVKCYLWNVMHKTNSMSNNVITPFIFGIRLVFFVKFKIPSTKIKSQNFPVFLGWKTRKGRTREKTCVIFSLRRN